MKEEAAGKNPDGSDHILYLIEGMSERILAELWVLYHSHPKFPLSVRVAGFTLRFERRCDLLSFYLGLQLGIEMNMI